jgi:hypothetical protein
MSILRLRTTRLYDRRQKKITRNVVSGFRFELSFVAAGTSQASSRENPANLYITTPLRAVY